MSYPDKMVNFNDDVQFSISDNVKKKNYQIITKNFNIRAFDAIEQENKKDINDLNCTLSDGTKVKFEFKNRREGARWSDIVLETFNNVRTGTLGWTFKLKENNIDYVIIIWHGKQKECYIILRAKELQKWWESNCNNYELRLNKPTRKDNAFWVSGYSFVPIKDLPKEIIFRHETYIDLNDFWGKK